MIDPEPIIAQIEAAFATTAYPGDAFLQGSFDGCEPTEEAGAFRGKSNWRSIAPDFLDGHSAALSFFSEGAFRYFLPAYLVADLRDQLRTADPVFHLTHGFAEIGVDAPTGTRVFRIRSGKTVLVNPRRYGAMTFEDAARHRLSVFTREEAAAIVAYLRYRGGRDDLGLDRRAIEAALTAFWLERSRSAPTALELADHLRREAEYFAALQADRPRPDALSP
jgi:hypothetical protein